MIDIKSFLKALEDGTPAHSGKHSFTYARTGSKKTGWVDQLALNVRLSNGDTQVIFLTQLDLEKSIEELVKQIKELLPKADGRGKPKGGEYERQVGYKLSLWISKGQRKDLLCRTVGSGAQFTFAQTRNQIAGIPGDLRSQDPLSDLFCNNYVIECKHWKDLDFLNFLRGEGELYKALQKVAKEANQLHKHYMLIARQNRRPDILITDKSVDESFHILFAQVYMYQLDEFLQKVTPEVLLGSESSERTLKGAEQTSQQGGTTSV